MIEFLGVIFGGASRLGQYWMQVKDKQAEREHEVAMFDLQAKLQEQKYTAEAQLRHMDAQVSASNEDAGALVAALQAQAQEARAAGGWVSKLSASVRPVASYWLLLIYTVSKIAQINIAMLSGAGLLASVQATYSTFDGALLGSIMAYWFADRSLRKQVA